MTSAVVRRLPALPTVRDILRIYGIKAKKRLSQNFLMDPSILHKFAHRAGPGSLKGKYVVEVGPGPGGITRALICNGATEVHVIEKDHRFKPSLKLIQEASGNVLHINFGDCLHYNMSALFPDELRRDWHDAPPDVRLVGNLPFNVATPFILKLIRSMEKKDNIFTYGRVPLLLTFQDEVAYRMIAPPGDVNRSRLSIVCQNYAQVQYKFRLPGGAFVPPPDVDVGVVSMLPLRTPYIDLPFKFVSQVATAVFRGKRKHLRNTVKNLFPPNIKQMSNTYELLRMASLDSELQAIQLTMDDMGKICFAFKHMCDQDPIIATYIQDEVRMASLEYQEANNLFLDDD